MSTLLPFRSRGLDAGNAPTDDDHLYEKEPKSPGAKSSDVSIHAKSLPASVSLEELKPPKHFWQHFHTQPNDLDSIATQPSVFDDPVTLEVYRPPPQYENSHRFDPDARWTWREERSIVRKIDWRIMLWASIMFFALDLDRTNISQANTDNFLQDLRLTTNDFNLGNTLYRLSFLLAELPSQLVSKRVGPDVWVPTQITMWSVAALSQFWLSGRTSFLATRFIIGFLEGGFIPDVVLYLSYFYTKKELPIRLAYFWVSNYLTTIISAFLATGILSLRNSGRAGWRYLFLIEGIITLAVGLASFFLMPPGPTQTKAWFRPKGWFTEREEIIMVNRVLRDDPSKSSMHNRQGLSPKMIWKALCDWRMWPLYILGIVHMIPVGPPQTYLTLSLRNLGFDTTQSNLLSIPSTVIGLLMLLFTSYLSEIVDSRVAATIVLQFWALPLLIALYTFTQETSQWAYFAVVTLITGFPYVHPIQVAWASRNSHSVRTRTVSASMYNIFVQAGAIVYANIYRADDAPLYKRGNRDLIGVCSMNIALYIFTFFFYRSINRHRDSKWAKMSTKEQLVYIETTKDEGNQRLDFRFAY
ncbi:MFS general substrate transporter [Leucogyrophana mollusca]|uniref:MFS general substrate transporter n=1 Tax=Leucogyrophana mollusca TaxID=85980 RepID=A0ACB8BBH4_9AGAM|nr:MFS general substrate transporter [Leucogyrophana mollusca]